MTRPPLRSLNCLVSLLVLGMQRSPLLVRLAHLEPLLAPRLAWVAKSGLPLLVVSGGVHTVTGATEIVPVSPSSNPAEVTVGETFTWVFRTTEGKKAQSYSVEGLPPGIYLSSIVTQGISSLSGIPTQAGSYTIELVGWELVGTRGDRTPTYRLMLEVGQGQPPVIDVPPNGGHYVAGNTIRLGVTASGTNLAYEWRRDGELLEDTSRPWIGASTPMQVFVPTGPIDDAWRSNPPFDASQWQSGHGGVGYELSSSNTFNPYFGIDIEKELYARNATALIRIPFHLEPEDLLRPNVLKLRLRYDDGFVAYLNGQKVAEANAPAQPVWNSEATDSHDDLLAVDFEEWDLVDRLGVLNVGDNLLAIHALNEGSTGSDFLMQAELLGGLTYDVDELHLHGAMPEDEGDYTVTVRNVTGSITSEPVRIDVAEANPPSSGYSFWAASYWQGPALDDPEISGMAADPDGDGVPNGIECLAGTEPTRADSLPRYRVTLEKHDETPKCLIQFPAGGQADDLATRVETSATMHAGSWQTLTGTEEGVEILQESGNLSIRVPLQPAKRFVRIVVVPRPERGL